MTCAPSERPKAAIAHPNGGADGLASSTSSAVLSHYDGVDDEHIVAGKICRPTATREQPLC